MELENELQRMWAESTRRDLATLPAVLYIRAVHTDFSLEPILLVLEGVFRERKMSGHLARLHAFRKGYAAQRQRLAGVQSKPWTSETVIELARVYQVPPFENDYPIAPNDGRCPHCRAHVASAPTCAMFADRSVCSCRKCARRFVRIAK